MVDKIIYSSAHLVISQMFNYMMMALPDKIITVLPTRDVQLYGNAYCVYNVTRDVVIIGNTKRLPKRAIETA